MWGQWRVVEGCGGLWRVVEGCGGLWRVVEGCRRCGGCGGVWRVVEGCGGLWRVVEGCRRCGGCGGVWRGVEGCGGLWRVMEGCRRCGGCGGAWFSGFWFLVGPPEATAKPKGGRRKIAAPNHPQGGLLGPARVGRSGQRVTAQPAPPGAVTGRKNFVFGGEGGLRFGVVVGRFSGEGGGGARGRTRGAARHHAGARRGAATHGRHVGLCWGAA